MSTFDNLRTCTRAEYDYFKAERKELQGLRVESLYVAMISLRIVVNGIDAVVLPIQLAQTSSTDVQFQVFNNKGRLSADVYGFNICADDFIQAEPGLFDGLDNEAGPGYIRDYNERCDGERPEVKTAADMSVVKPVLIPRTRILVGV